MFLRVLMLIRQLHRRSALFVTIDNFLNKEFRFQSSLCNGRHDISMIPISIISIAALNIHGPDWFVLLLEVPKMKP